MEVAEGEGERELILKELPHKKGETEREREGGQQQEQGRKFSQREKRPLRAEF